MAETKRITEEYGADLVLESIGKTTFASSLEAAATHETVVCYGWSSGLPDPIAPIDLVARSLKIAGDNLVNATATREVLLRRANDVIEGIRAGWLNLHIDSVLSLQQTAEAHKRLESRNSIGKILLNITA